MRLALIYAILASTAAPSQQLQDLVKSGTLSDLRWPNFTRLQPDIARFYELNGYQLAWLRAGSPTPQAQAVIRALQDAALKGLDSRDYEFASGVGPERFDLALTVSGMRYISDVSSGKVDPAVFSFGLHFDQRKCDLAEAVRTLTTASDVVAELSRLEPPYQGYWRTEKALAQYLERPQEDAKQIRKLQLVLERWRWVPHSFSRPPIVVNIPEFRLRAYDDQYRPELEMKVVVGKAYRHKTPVFSNQMTYVIFRPYWEVPLSIQRAELVPKIAKDQAYLAANEYEIVNSRREVVPSSVVTPEMLEQLRSGKLFIRQIPGIRTRSGTSSFFFRMSTTCTCTVRPQNRCF